MSSREIVRVDSVGSTQALAFDLAERGAADGTVVVAETQTAGRGRRGRTWVDEPGASLLMSTVVRPGLAARDLPKLSLAAAVAVGEALRALTGLDARLKWPNDVLTHGRKIAGILLESRIGAEPLVVAGIGINLRQRSFPPEVAGSATSVALESGRDVDPETLLGAVLEAFDRWRTRLEGEGFAPLRERWLALADTIGRTVSVAGLEGVAVDLDADGALVLREAHGEHHVVAGELTVAGRD
jgi:BirA family biotin operon repressor/biotin-[acetyl-CoA-carboxylase] ligase